MVPANSPLQSPASTTGSEPCLDKTVTGVLEFKAAGNQFHKEANYSEAVREYTSAIQLAESVLTDDCAGATSVTDELQHTHLPMLLCNRSLCHAKLENFGAAIADATRAASLSRTKQARSKALFRRGSAHVCLTKYENAVRDFKAASKLTPGDKVLETRLKEAEKLRKEQKFAEAIKADAQQPISSTIDLTSYTIDTKQYKGPVYNGESSRTPEFFQELVTYFKSNHNNRFHKKCILHLALDIIGLYREQPNIIDINVPAESGERITVCGDIHGQFYDLLSIFEKNGWPSETNRYLFNGDFVDRGSFSVEVICTLYLAKLVWPNHFFLTRGNHESRRMTKLYGFEGEMRVKASGTIYDVYCESFDHLPLAHCINNRIFVVHGGLSSRMGVTLQEINELNRCRDDEEGLMTDLLWADPQPWPGSSPSKRGVSNNFGPDITNDFLKTNSLEMVIRSHEMKDKGYELAHDGKLITVFSAPNYCDQMGNQGAYMRFEGPDLNDRSKEVKPEILVFSSVPHPPVAAMKYANPVFM